MTWRTYLLALIAWVSVACLHALSQYSDIIRYEREVSFGFSSVALLILSYSFWVVVTIFLLNRMKALSFPFKFRSLAGLFIIVWMCWLSIYFALDSGIATMLEGEGLADWLTRFKSMSNSIIFFYSVLYALTFAACLGVVLAKKTQEARNLSLKLKQQQTESALLLSNQQMQLMQSQLSPHFLFNCMGAISGLARKGERETLIKAVATVGDLLRFTVTNSTSNLITIADELEFAKDYIALQQLRFENRFSCQFDIGEIEADVMCPPCVLQVLLENVFCHAVEPTQERVNIQVLVEQADASVRLKVFNDIFDTDTRDNGTGSGLKNLEKRLSHVYGQKFTLTIEQQKDMFSAFVSIPVRAEQNGL